MELHEFLLARIGEDEAEAQGWRTFPWDVQCPCGLEGQLDDYTCFDGRLPERLSITHVVGSIPPPVVGGLVMAGWQTQTLTHVLTREQTRDLWASREVTDHLRELLWPPYAPADAWVAEPKVGLISVAYDKYGDRIDGDVLLVGESLSARMIRDGYAAAWDGRGKAPVPPWPIPGATT